MAGFFVCDRSRETAAVPNPSRATARREAKSGSVDAVDKYGLGHCVLYNLGMPENGGAVSHKKLYLWGLVAAAILLAGIAYATYWARSNDGTQSSTNAVNAALVQSQTAAETTIPSTSNPVKDATPAVNPVEAANPFNTSSARNTNSSTNDYKNPFQ